MTLCKGFTSPFNRHGQTDLPSFWKPTFLISQQKLIFSSVVPHIVDTAGKVNMYEERTAAAAAAAAVGGFVQSVTKGVGALEVH